MKYYPKEIEEAISTGQLCKSTYDGDLERVGFRIFWDHRFAGVVQKEEIHVWVDEFGKLHIEVGFRGKEFFLDLMSKLYDMAEVK